MAQTFQLPFAFEFRTSKVEWNVKPIQIVGWWKRDDGTIDSQSLAAKPAGDFKREPFEVPLASLPDDLEEACMDAWSDSDDDESVRQLCSTFTPTLLIPSGNAYVTIEAIRKRDTLADAWQLREEFLRLRLDESSVWEFLNKWGLWTHGSYARIREIGHLQTAVRDALLESSEKWFASHFSSPFMFGRLPKYPFFAVITNSCELAIRTTVTIDLLKRLKFKECARRDCPLPFAITSRHKKKYCSQYCAHLESVRRTRREQKKLAARARKG